MTHPVQKKKLLKILFLFVKYFSQNIKFDGSDHFLKKLVILVFIKQARWSWSIGVVFFRSHGIFHSQDFFPSSFHLRLWETSSGEVTREWTTL